MSDDPLLKAINDGDVHDQLLGYKQDGESAEAALGRLLRALPSFAHRECGNCGRDLAPLAESDFVATRFPVEDTDYRRTDVYCGFTCLADAMDAEFRFNVRESQEADR
jgi:hypothetical protein